MESAACKEVPAGGVAKSPEAPQVSRRLLPDEVIPSDLDVVVRVDLQKLRGTLGPDFDRELAARLGDDPMVARALPRARAMLLGLRAADWTAGDRVLVLEGDLGDLGLERAGFIRAESKNEKVRIFTRSLIAERAGVDTVVVLDERAVAFVSPVETDAVLRVVKRGADEGRGQPVAEGIVSADVRVHRLPPSLERKYPSFGRLLAQVQRIKAVLRVQDDGLKIEGEVITKSEDAADKVRRFFDAFREGATGTDGISLALRSMKLEKLGAIVRVRAVLTVADLAGLLSKARPEEPKPAPVPGSD